MQLISVKNRSMVGETTASFHTNSWTLTLLFVLDRMVYEQWCRYYWPVAVDKTLKYRLEPTLCPHKVYELYAMGFSVAVSMCDGKRPIDDVYWMSRICG